eukprot:1722509-Rhodomonas_salina.1
MTYWDHTRSCRAILDHVFVGDQKAARASVTVKPSWHPSHDHGNLYVYARTAYLPGRPAVGSYKPPQKRVRMKSWESKKAEWGPLSKM